MKGKFPWVSLEIYFESHEFLKNGLFLENLRFYFEKRSSMDFWKDIFCSMRFWKMGLFIYLENLFNVQCKPLPWESGYIQHIYLYYNVKPNFLTFGWPHHVASHKFLKSHNFTPHYFNIYFLIEFQFYSIIKPFIRILTHHIFFNIRIYYSIYKIQSYLISNTKIYSMYKHNINIF